MESKVELTYRDAGVDISGASSMISQMDKTRSRASEVISTANDFAGLFSLKELQKRYSDPVLISSTDGVGTKVLIALAFDSYAGLGQDLVAMCANDIAAKGAEPLFFLDYFATSQLSSTPFLKIVNGIVAACDEINCALIGGETAEMPALYAQKHFDLAGFIVGVAERSKIFGAHLVEENDALIGIRSSGLHANGYSLVRKIMLDKLKHHQNDVLWQTERGVSTVAHELLMPTKLYSTTIRALKESNIEVHAAANITGGGFTENIPRMLPAHLMADINLLKFDTPPIFSYLMEHGPISQEEMLQTFNMGWGMVLALPQKDCQKAIACLRSNGESASEIGQVIACKGEKRCRVTL